MSLFGRRGPTAAEVVREEYIKRSITDQLIKALRKLQQTYVNSDEPIRSEDVANEVCNVLEAIFLHELKSKLTYKMSNFLTGHNPDKAIQPTFWELLVKITHKDVILQLTHLGLITTDIGMCRAWIRLALNDGVLESYLDVLLQQKALLRQYYKETAYLRDEEHPGILKTYIQGLLNFQFALSFNSSMLNMWTTTPLVLAGLLEPQITPPAMVASTTEGSTDKISDESVEEAAPSVNEPSNPAQPQPMTGPATLRPFSPSQSTSKSKGARIVSSIGYRGDARVVPSPPTNTPFDPTQLTRTDIDEIREMAQRLNEMDETGSSRSSQISHPDPAEFCMPPSVGVMATSRSDRHASSTSGHPTGHSNKRNQSKSPIKSASKSKKRDTASNRSDESTKSSKSLPSSDSYHDGPKSEAAERSSDATIMSISEDHSTVTSLSEDSVTTPLLQSVLDGGDVTETVATVLTSERHGGEPSAVNRVSPVPSTDSVAGENTMSNVSMLHATSTSSPVRCIRSQRASPMTFDDKIISELSEAAGETMDNVESTGDQSNEDVDQFDENKILQPSPARSAPLRASPHRMAFPSEFSPRRRKSQPLEPVETHVTATSTFVEVAMEVSPSMIIDNNSQEEEEERGMRDEFYVDVEDYDMIHGPPPQSNSLGANIDRMRGWSSDFDEGVRTSWPTSEEEDSSNPTSHEVEIVSTEEIKEAMDAKQRSDTGVTHTTGESFDDLLQDYTPSSRQMKRPSMIEVLEELPDPSPPSQFVKPEPEEEGFDCELTKDYEVLPQIDEIKSEAHSQKLHDVIGTLCWEKGLDVQNYQCNSCSRPVGIIYGKARVCTYDGCYYCYECHENEEYYIPSRIVINWDFRKHKVSKTSLLFLQDVEDQPLLDVNEINPKIYEHVDAMKNLLTLRTKLRFLKAYVFTCRQSVADDFRKLIWPKDYLYDDIHRYSLQDLLQTENGVLAAFVARIIDWASKHVYDCRLCSQKGFFCEICNSAKVIYPFQTDFTVACERCGAIFHLTCKTDAIPCPKCDRRQRRRSYLGQPEINTPQGSDYAFAPDIDVDAETDSSEGRAI